MAFDSILVNDSGIQIAYTDTGAPSQSPYITIVAVPGMCFSAAIFKRVQSVAIKRGVRFVALNRRNYPGTTPYNEEEIKVISSGTKEQRDAWHRDRGHEVGMFIHKLIVRENLPPISADRRTGGVILLGWSIGAGDVNNTIAHADTLPSEVRTSLASYMRSMIVQDSHRVMLGDSMEPKHYTPLMDDQIPPEDRLEKFGYWVSSYFQHGDLSTRNLDVLSWVEPSTIHPATLSNMTADEKKEIICIDKEPAYEVPYMVGSKEQFADAYRKAFFGESVRTLFPGFKASFMAGELSPAFAISSYWMLENDIKETGKSFNLRFIPDSNHFIHWDDPEEALKIYLECS